MQEKAVLAIYRFQKVYGRKAIGRAKGVPRLNALDVTINLRNDILIQFGCVMIICLRKRRDSLSKRDN